MVDSASPCLNCGDPTPGAYCPTCGQRKADVQVSIRAMMANVLEDELTVDRRLPLTLQALFFKPGKLSVEYVNGRIVRYVRPFRLYLVSSVIFFLLLSFTSLRFLREAEFPQGAAPAVVVVDTLTAAQLDSALVEVRAELEEPDLDGATRDSLRARRNALIRQRAALELRDLVPDQSDAAPPRGTGPAANEPLAFLEDAPIRLGHPTLDSAATAKIRTLRRLGPRQAAERLISDFLRYVPTSMFILLPFFAGMLKLLYLARRRFYAEHFIFLLHTHAFIYLLFTVLLLAVVLGLFRGWLLTALLGWMLVYTYLAMRRMYGQSWLKTFAKWVVLGWTYFWGLGAAVVLVFLTTALLA